MTNMLFTIYRSRRWARRAAMFGVGLLTACGGGAATPTQVVSSAPWGELQPTYDNVVRAWAKGTHENRGNSVQLVDGQYEDMLGDGNTVYVKAEWYYRTATSSTSCSGWGSSFSCSNGSGVGWSSDGQTVSAEISSAKGRLDIRQLGGDMLQSTLQPTGEGARAIVATCGQFGFPVPDPCASATISFAY